MGANDDWSRLLHGEKMNIDIENGRIGDRKSRYGSAQEIHERARKACIAEASEIMDMECVPYGAAKAFELGMKRMDKDVPEVEAMAKLKSAVTKYEIERESMPFATSSLQEITIAAQQIWEAQ